MSVPTTTSSAPLGLVPRERWRELDDDERAAVRALAEHLRRRVRKTEHDPFIEIGGVRCGTFLTNDHVSGLLRAIRYRKSGRDFARATIRTLERLRIIEYDGWTMKPRRRPGHWMRHEHDGTGRGGQHAQTSPHRSYWWKVYRVVPVEALQRAGARRRGPGGGAYDGGRADWNEAGDADTAERSLRRWLVAQGLIAPLPRRRTFGKGSVQWAFAATGPP